MDLADERAIQKGTKKEGKQKYQIDTALLNKRMLMKIGLKEENILDCNICTVCHLEQMHSYRVEKENSGRMAAVILLS